MHTAHTTRKLLSPNKHTITLKSRQNTNLQTSKYLLILVKIGFGVATGGGLGAGILGWGIEIVE